MIYKHQKNINLKQKKIKKISIFFKNAFKTQCQTHVIELV